jgi:beta-lactamase class C
MQYQFSPGLMLTAALMAAIAPVVRAADPVIETDPLRRTVDDAIRPVMAKYDVPGMAVAVITDGQTRYFNYGVASRESGAPVTESTLFELGSISKTFTATLGAYAQVQGKLSLDDHPGRYLPALRGSALDQATLLHLCTYTAGGLRQQVPEEVKTLPQMFTYFQHWKPDAAPGRQRHYSNPSIGLFGHIVGVALGSDFADAAQRQLFPQLGLRHTYIHVPPEAMPGYAWGYRKDKAVRVNPDVFDNEAYGVKSTAADMIRYVQLNIDPSPLAAPMRSAIEATHAGYFQAGPMTQGLGWEHYPYPVSLERLLDGNSASMATDAHAVTPLTPARIPAAPALYNKTGSTGGFGGYVAFVPERKIGIVMLANRSYPNAARIEAAYAILAKLGQP